MDPESLENLPAGLEGAGYSLVDLDGDGVAGVLAEQAGAWYYRRNLSPLGDGAGGPRARFAPVREVGSKPAGAGTPGERWQWIDISGDGQPDLVQLGGPVTGYHERAPDGGWEGFTPFGSAPNLRWDDPDVKLVDLTGDGRPDVLITQDDVLRWHASQGVDSGKLSSSGSTQARSAMRGYKPGVGAWYNQFLTVDPADPNHVYLGLEEVYETTNGGSSWNTLGPYWNLTLKCFSYTPFEGTCNHQQTHSDQHAVFLDTAGGRDTLYVGNDGGVWSKSMSDHTQGNWTNLNRNINTLQYYAASGSNDGSLYGGMQDNGSARTFPAPTTVIGDTGTPVPATSVQVFGGDGGYTIVDPNNPNKVITEYVFLNSARSNDGGRTWVDNPPGDPNARFIAPIVLDHTQPVDAAGNGHIVAGGAYVWDSTKGFNTNSSDWRPIYDLTSGGAFPARQTTAIGTATVGGVTTTWVAWCGPCNPNGAGTGFTSGIVVLSNSGGSYHVVNSFLTGGASALPQRYITGVFVDPANPTNAYVSISGYSRHWIVGPNDPGVGHVFQITGPGSTWTITDRSGNLIDAPTGDVVVVNGDLVVGTDFGVYASADNGATWSRLGANLPNVVVDQLYPTAGKILAATHGRGLWTFPDGSLP